MIARTSVVFRVEEKDSLDRLNEVCSLSDLQGLDGFNGNESQGRNKLEVERRRGWESCHEAGWITDSLADRIFVSFKAN